MGNDKETVVYTTLSVLMLYGAMTELGMSGVIVVEGPKGEVSIKAKAEKYNINNSKVTRQNQLTKEYFETLEYNGIIDAGRSGGKAPGKSIPNSYYKTTGNHVVIYNNKGYKLMDISANRIKIYKVNVNPNNPSQTRVSHDKILDTNGLVEQTYQWILDFFGL